MSCLLPKASRSIPSSDSRLGISWLSTTVLRTVHRILQMIPELGGHASEYIFSIPDFVRDEDSKLFRYFLWEKTPQSESDLGESSVKMVQVVRKKFIVLSHVCVLVKSPFLRATRRYLNTSLCVFFRLLKMRSAEIPSPFFMTKGKFP